MLTCTACNLSFESGAEQKDHFRDDWHRYNLKRKVAELLPISKEAFELRMKQVADQRQNQLDKMPKKMQQAVKLQQKPKAGAKAAAVDAPKTKSFKCLACNKSFANENAHENHLNSKKHIANVKNFKEEEVTTQMVDAAPVASQNDKVVGELAQQMDHTLTLEELRERVPLAREDCIFCSHTAKDFDACLNHMLKEHGFFIPDVEYLVDLQGLVAYLAEKVKLGGFCLYCNGKGKSFGTYQDAQKHMVAKSHCKILYESEEDLDELADFYDFSSQLDKLKAEKKRQKAQQADAEDAGGEEDENDDEEWETESEVSLDEEELEAMEEEGEYVDDEDDENSIGVTETGELVLADGRRLGRREFRRYYRQRFRPEDTRDAVLAVTKERLLLAYQSAGIDPASCTALSTAFVANFLKKRNNIADGNTIMQQRRQAFIKERQRGRLDFRSHKLQKNPNRRAMVTV